MLGVEAWTSLAYVASGAFVLTLVVRHRLRPVFALLGALAAAEGVGSLLYHGRGGDPAHFLHDIAMVTVLGFVAGWHVGRLVRRRRAADVGALAGAAVASSVGTVAWAVAPSSTNVMVAVAVVTVAVAEVGARRRGLPAVCTAPLLAIGLAALLAWLVGGQLHGLWHVLTALLLLGWAVGASHAQEPELYGAADESTSGVAPRDGRNGVVHRRR